MSTETLNEIDWCSSNYVESLLISLGLNIKSAFNVSLRKVGGIWFAKAGRLTLSFCVSRP